MEMLFPNTEKLLDEKNVNLGRFDEIYSRTTKSAGDGYFILSCKDGVVYLFIVGGHPYAAGTMRKEGPDFLDVREFFDTFSAIGSGDISFYKVEKKLLQSILIYFSNEPSQKFTSDMVDMERVLSNIEAEGKDCLIATMTDKATGFSICIKGRVSFNYLYDSAPTNDPPKDALLVYIFGHKAPQLSIQIISDLHITPAADAIPPKTEMPKSLTEHYSKHPASASVSGMEITVMLDNKTIGKIPLTKAETTIGRNPGNDIVLNNPGVSRNHAVIREENGRFFVEDKESSNGTMVNGEKITNKEIKNGDQIQVLKYLLLLQYQAPAAAAEEAAAEKTMYIDPSAIKVKKDGGPKMVLEDGREFPLKSTVTTIGSGENMEIRVEGGMISAHQASILMGKGGEATLVSKGGLFSSTKVNGAKIQQQVLKDGDKIEIGKYKIRYKS